MTQEPWYERWFGEAYLSAYPHRDTAEARDVVRLVLDHAHLPEGSDVLDIACGAGRHLEQFRDAGMAPLGLDLSEPLLERARAKGLEVVRGDMRDLPFADDAFDLVTNFFTSFGYFADADDDALVLREAHRVLRPGGWFVFDFLNADRVRRELVERDERVVDGRRVVQTRRLADDGRVVEKRIDIHDPYDRVPHAYFERVRLYSPEELEDLLDDHDLVTLRRFGDYDGAPLRDQSPRTIFVGRSR